MTVPVPDHVEQMIDLETCSAPRSQFRRLNFACTDTSDSVPHRDGADGSSCAFLAIKLIAVMVPDGRESE